uniref:Uncharacterized protein n=1 Tax=Rhizophora mucronata TaxID=61149 RepID=A0A2P2N6L6_RHIMU
MELKLEIPDHKARNVDYGRRT